MNSHSIRLLILALVVTGFTWCNSVNASDLLRATPESQGISSAAIREFVEAADEQVQ